MVDGLSFLTGRIVASRVVMEHNHVCGSAIILYQVEAAYSVWVVLWKQNRALWTVQVRLVYKAAQKYLGLNVRKRTFGHLRRVKNQISLRICTG